MIELDAKVPQDLRERYLASLSPIERMDYEMACARERRLVAERKQDQRDTALLLERIEVRAGDHRRRGLLLDADELRLLAAELRRLKRGAGDQSLLYDPAPKAKVERDYKITLRCDERRVFGGRR